MCVSPHLSHWKVWLTVVSLQLQLIKTNQKEHKDNRSPEADARLLLSGQPSLMFLPPSSSDGYRCCLPQQKPICFIALLPHSLQSLGKCFPFSLLESIHWSSSCRCESSSTNHFKTHCSHISLWNISCSSNRNLWKKTKKIITYRSLSPSDLRV